MCLQFSSADEGYKNLPEHILVVFYGLSTWKDIDSFWNVLSMPSICVIPNEDVVDEFSADVQHTVMFEDALRA